MSTTITEELRRQKKICLATDRGTGTGHRFTGSQ